MRFPLKSPALRRLPLLAVLGVGIAGAAAANGPAIPFSPEQVRSLGITLAAPKAVLSAAGQTLSAKVIAAPDAEWVVTAQTGGVVVRLPVSEGDRVGPHTVLAELRSAEAPQLGAELIQAEAAAKLARAEHARDQQLHQDGIIAARRVQASEQALVQADSRLAAARMRLRLMGISAAEARNGRVLMRAPAPATVLERLVVPGQRVAESDALLRLVDANRLMLELQVPVAEASLAVGDTLLLGSGERATVQQAGWGTRETAQTVRVRAALPAGHSGLRPGQWLKVQRETPGTAAWVLPATAISRHGEQIVVFAQSPGGFLAVPVTVLAADAATATVAGALTAQSRVASAGTIAIKGAWLGHGGGE